MPAIHPSQWIRPLQHGLGIIGRDGEPVFHIDATRASTTVVVTHGHADHARPGHKHVIATPETLAIMAARYGDQFAEKTTPLPYHERMRIGEIDVCLKPAGHVLGSAQIVLDHQGSRVVVSGDYKRKNDPTCAAFEPVKCDVFITEATFALPVFHHPDPKTEIDRLLASLTLFPHRAHVIGAYSLGKAQRVIALLRQAGYTPPIYIHGALTKLCQLYQDHGIALGSLQAATAGKKGQPQDNLAGQIVMASGWMQVRQRAKQSGVELPLVLSDHADWGDLLATIDEVSPKEVWVTHGREDALIRALAMKGITGKALHLIGYEDDAE
jgi:putative mRNA 3-end processing factor